MYYHFKNNFWATHQTPELRSHHAKTDKSCHPWGGIS